MSDALPILTQRRIEAAFAKGVYDEMKAELGEATAKRILSSAVIKLAKQTAAEMAKAGAGRRAKSRQSFRAIQPRWTAEDALRIEVVKSTDTEFDFNVTRCRYAEMYRAMGLAELGAVLSCNRDGAFCEGYDPRSETSAHADADGRRDALRFPLSVGGGGAGVTPLFAPGHSRDSSGRPGAMA